MDPTPIVGTYILHTAPISWGLAMMLLSVRPDEAARIRGVAFYVVVLGGFSGLIVIASVLRFHSAGWTGYAIACVVTVIVVWGWCLHALYLLYGHRCDRSEPMPPRRQLQRLWLGFYAWILTLAALMGCTGIFRLLCSGSECMIPPRDHIICFISAMLSLLMITPANRGRIIRRLSSLGKRGPAEQQAASVASLLGDTSVEQAVATAIQCFRAQPISTLTAAALINNEPDPSLHAHTVPATLGAVDAFMSHSWCTSRRPNQRTRQRWRARALSRARRLARRARRRSDDGGLKHDKLLEWARELDGDDNKLVWLDKSCIDQLNIDASLSCLPVFLSGCQQLLMLIGPTCMRMGL